MAISSIFTTVKITDPQKAEAFIDAMDAASNDTKTKKKATTHSLLTDSNEIKKIIAKRDKK